jgi:hypothetical protein
MSANDAAEKIFRQHYVPNYPKEKSISEMTSTEQMIFDQVQMIISMLFSDITLLEQWAKENEYVKITTEDIKCFASAIRALEEEGYNKNFINPKIRLFEKLGGIK